MNLTEIEILKCMTESERKTKKQVCIGKIHGSAIFEQIQNASGSYEYSAYEQMPDDTWRLDHRGEYEGFIPLAKTPLVHPPPPAPYESEEQLYNTVRAYIHKHLDLLNPNGYDILASFVFSTWIPELFDFTCYLGFYGREAVGKTRALEVLNQLCFRSWFTANLTVATLFRLTEKLQPTLLLDESEFLTSEDKKELIGLLNAGQRRGLMIPRMKEDNTEPEFFNVYCPKVLSGTQQLKRTITSRMVVFTMTKNVRQMPRRIDTAESAKLRSQLLMWRFETLSKLIGTEMKTTTEFKELEPLSGRSFELFYPLYYSAPATARPNILEFAKELEEIKLKTEKTELSSMIFEAILNLKNQAHRGLILLKDISRYINTPNDPSLWIPEKTIGRKLSQMGFEKTRTNRGSAIMLNPALIERLRKDPRYSTDILNFSDESDGSDDKTPTERAKNWLQ